MTRKRDFVDLRVCRGSAGSLAGREGQQRATGSAWTAHYCRPQGVVGEGQGGQGCDGAFLGVLSQIVSSPSSFYKQVWGWGGDTPESKRS